MSLRPSRSFRQSSRVIRLHFARVFWKSASMSAAAGVYQSVVGFILILVANAIVRRVDEDSALF